MREGMVGHWRIALILFAIALTIRLLFLHATADSSWPYSFGFKGDSLVFMSQALGMHRPDLPIEQRFELGLPLRAPGGAYLVYWFWTENLAFIRHVWIVMGAAIAPVLYLTARQGLGDRAALFAAGFTAVASGPLLLSSALSSETPYLLGATASISVLTRLRARSTHRVGWLIGWSVAQALLCLLRAEHVVFFGAALVWIVRGKERVLASALGSVIAFGLTLLPWELSAHATIAELNDHEVAVSYGLPWDTAARDAIQAMPAFARQSAVGFIEVTVGVRGRQRVVAGDIEILREAYDHVPTPLSTWPFIAISGPMNFYIGNHESTADGFSREALFAPPPLHGGEQRFPPRLVLPQDLVPGYPPHNKILNDGYSLGVRRIAADPLAWLGRVWGKLTRTWDGVAHGFGGYAIPVGMSGTRRQADFVVPTSAWSAVWRGLVFVLFVLGLREAIRCPEARPWLLWILTRMIVVIAFYGYARQGALLIPATGVLFGLLFARFGSKRAARIAAALLAGLLAAEVFRFLQPPTITMGGSKIERVDPARALIKDQPVSVEHWR